MEIKNKIILITGGTGGLGQELISLISKNAKKIIILARNKNKILALLEKYGKEKLDYYLVDFSKKNKILEACTKIKKKYPVIDLLINNLGIGTHESFFSSSKKNLELMISTTLFSHLLLTHELVSNLGINGKIVNIGSVAESIYLPYMGTYSIAKSGINSFSRIIRLELKQKKISVLHVTLGPLENENFEKNMISKKQNNFKIKKTTLTYAANKILHGIINDRQRIVIPYWYSFLIFFDYAFPIFSDNLKLFIFKKKNI